ncbi:hypothetical protein ACNUDN_01533 [Mycobacterium sp. smrl_JER01]
MVITHSGVGTLMEILDMGVFPVVVPRLARRGEHVDDHQLQAAGILRDLGIAAVTDAEDLSRDTIMRAAAHTIAKQGAC